MALYTEEDYQLALANNNALEYAMSRGYELKPVGNRFIMPVHDSMVFLRDGSCFWNSRYPGRRLSALDFMLVYEGLSWGEAVRTLADMARGQGLTPVVDGIGDRAPYQRPEYSPLPQSDDREAVQDYLGRKRGLDVRVVDEMFRQGCLYQGWYRSSKGAEDRPEIPVAVFPYFSEDGKEIGAFLRGLWDSPGKKSWKSCVSGSNRKRGWMLRGGREASEVRYFEAAIDAASDASLDVLAGKPLSEQSIDRLSGEGLQSEPLITYLTEHPQVKTVRLCLDGDEPGQRMEGLLEALLRQKGYQVDVCRSIPPYGKDWNDTLLEMRADRARLPVRKRQITQQRQEPEQTLSR